MLHALACHFARYRSHHQRTVSKAAKHPRLHSTCYVRIQWPVRMSVSLRHGEILEVERFALGSCSPQTQATPWKGACHKHCACVWLTCVEEATSGARKRGKPRARRFCLMGRLACFFISLSPLVRLFLSLNTRLLLLNSLSSWRTPGPLPRTSASQSGLMCDCMV